MAVPLFADEGGITLKQGVIYPWKTGELKNITVLDGVNTKAVESYPKWLNAIIDGWTLDPAWAYDGSSANSGALLLGRKVGTLADYVPFLNYSILDKFDITIYPIGLYAEDLFNTTKTQAVSGLVYFSKKF